MSAYSNPRLAAAVAELSAADRALFSLYAERELSDARIAELTGVDAATVTTRRERILQELGEAAGMPAAAVLAALRARAPESEPAPPPEPSPAPEPTPRPEPSPVPEPTPPPEASPAPEPSPAPERPLATAPAPAPLIPPSDRDDHPGRAYGLIAAACLLAAIVVVIVALLGTHQHRTTDGRPAAHTTTTPPAPTTTTTSTPTTTATTTSGSTTATRTATSSRILLRPLPGGLRRAHGTARLVRHGRRAVLVVDIRHLPHRRHGHYEVYLYDSLLDSRALGRVRVGHVARLRLPRDAGAYRSIDVSLQPRGATGPSGESRLRGPNPARR